MNRGEIWLVNLDPTIGAEIEKTRPAIIINVDEIGILPLKVIIPISQKRLIKRVGSISELVIKEILIALSLVFGIEI